MPAPDFAPKTIEVLSSRAAFYCSNPDCGVLTVGPHSEDSKKLVIGEAAHIFGARPGKLRYRSEMSDEERAQITNGIWLCRNCHGEIDKDPDRFPPDLLFSWKRVHEENVLENVGSKTAKIRSKLTDRKLEPFKLLPLYIQDIVRLEPPGWEYFLTAALLEHYMQAAIRRGNDFRKGLILKRLRLVPAEFLLAWLETKPNELIAATEAAKNLVPEIHAAWGAPGQRGDEREINHVCSLFGELATYFEEAAEDIRFTTVPPEFEAMAEAMIDANLHLLERLASFPNSLRSLISDVQAGKSRELTLVFDLPDGWDSEMDRGIEKMRDAVESGQLR